MTTHKMPMTTFKYRSWRCKFATTPWSASTSIVLERTLSSSASCTATLSLNALCTLSLSIFNFTLDSVTTMDQSNERICSRPPSKLGNDRSVVRDWHPYLMSPHQLQDRDYRPLPQTSAKFCSKTAKTWTSYTKTTILHYYTNSAQIGGTTNWEQVYSILNPVTTNWTLKQTAP